MLDDNLGCPEMKTCLDYHICNVADIARRQIIEEVFAILKSNGFSTSSMWLRNKLKEKKYMPMLMPMLDDCECSGVRSDSTITDLYRKIMEDISEVKEQRGRMYRREPKDIVPIETLEHLAYLKAVRGMESVDLDKKIDEYKDLINYAVFVLERLYKERTALMKDVVKTANNIAKK
jgi:hypothetical protein